MNDILLLILLVENVLRMDKTLLRKLVSLLAGQKKTGAHLGTSSYFD